jgi:ABC-type Fe3+ transport system permease subunit
MKTLVFLSTLHYKVLMNTTKRFLAASQLLLICPAVLFMASLFVRNVTPVQNEPAHTAQRIVMWYAARPHLGLWVLLTALPLAVFVIGCGALVQRWHEDQELRQATRRMLDAIGSHLATAFTAAATLAAGAILAIVAVHMMTD